MAALEFGPESVSGTAITLERNGVPVPAYCASATTPTAGLVIATDIGGVRPLFAEMCDRLASHGLAVIAVEPFAQHPDVREKNGPDRLLDVARLRDDEQVADLVAGADYLARTYGVPKVSVLGFCMGGMYALKAAASGRFDQAVECYGMLRLPVDWRGGAQHDALETIAEVCPTLAIMGDADPWIPGEQIEELRRAWADRPDCEIVVVPGADHGFIHDPDRPAHRPEDARSAWEAILRRVR